METLNHYYYESSFKQDAIISLPSDTTKHIVTVLRMNVGQEIILCNGLGDAAKCIITIADKRNCQVKITALKHYPKAENSLHLALSFTKNSSRNEWLLEKATELGLSQITPLICQRSEKVFIKQERWKNILVSAMLQSQQYYLPTFNTVIPFEQFITQHPNESQKFIAHCEQGYERKQLSKCLSNQSGALVLIGPEGDFSPKEIELAYAHKFEGVALGHQRLRTETAAMAVCSYYALLENEKNI